MEELLQVLLDVPRRISEVDVLDAELGRTPSPIVRHCPNQSTSPFKMPSSRDQPISSCTAGLRLRHHRRVAVLGGPSDSELLRLLLLRGLLARRLALLALLIPFLGMSQRL